MFSTNFTDVFIQQLGEMIQIKYNMKHTFLVWIWLGKKLDRSLDILLVAVPSSILFDFLFFLSNILRIIDLYYLANAP